MSCAAIKRSVFSEFIETDYIRQYLSVIKHKSMEQCKTCFVPDFLKITKGAA